MDQQTWTEEGRRGTRWHGGVVARLVARSFSKRQPALRYWLATVLGKLLSVKFTVELLSQLNSAKSVPSAKNTSNSNIHTATSWYAVKGQRTKANKK